MFSSIAYTILAGVIFFVMLIPLSMLSEFIFVEPFFTFHIQYGRAFGFMLILDVSVMSAIIIPMNIYKIRTLQKSASKIGGGVLGSIWVCTNIYIWSCWHRSAFLSNYEILHRLGSVGILCLVYILQQSPFRPNARLTN